MAKNDKAVASYQNSDTRNGVLDRQLHRIAPGETLPFKVGGAPFTVSYEEAPDQPDPKVGWFEVTGAIAFRQRVRYDNRFAKKFAVENVVRAIRDKVTR